jgi:uncharacterized coiled-coil DUF342 family protein
MPAARKQSTAKRLDKLKKDIDAAIAQIGKDRDRLRELLDEANEIAEDLDSGLDELNEARETIDRVADTMSKFI